MKEDSNVSSRIAKNTLALYVRMFFLMIVSLYSSRVVLDQMGTSDYGIYTVIGDIVMIINFFVTAMTGSIQRFMNVELGKNSELSVLRKLFSCSVAINLLLSLAVLVLAETLGLWYVNNVMQFDVSRTFAVQVIYQLSVFNLIIGIVVTPFNAAIITHEHIGVFALFSVVEAIEKLLFILILPYIPYDKLIAFSSMVFVIGTSLSFCYVWYARKHFAESHQLDWHIDWSVLKKIASFTSWSLLGVLEMLFHFQIITMIVNIFYGTVVNAAYGIANQVNGIAKRFVQNFLIALNPQLVKTYAAGELLEMHSLMSRGCRMAVVLVSFFVIPLTLEAPVILSLWLKDVPEYTVIFVRLILFVTLLDCCSGIFTTAVGANGDIRKYNIVCTLIGFVHVLLTWIFFRLGYPPYVTLYIYIGVVVVMNVARLSFVIKLVGISLKRFVLPVFCRCIAFVLASFSLPLLIHQFLSPGFKTALYVIIIGVISTSCFAAYIALYKSERGFVWDIIKRKFGCNKKEC